MKKWLIVLLLLSGCYEENQSSTSEEVTVSSYQSWIERETWKSPIDEQIQVWDGSGPDFDGISQLKSWVLQNTEYIRDKEHYGKDYWQTAMETASIKQGDCDDRAAMYYVMLLYMGYPEDKMDGFILNKYRNGTFDCVHALMGFYIDGYSDEYLLNASGIRLMELPIESDHITYEITHVFNREGIWKW